MTTCKIILFGCSLDATFTFSDLNDTRITPKKEVTFSATLVVGRLEGDIVAHRARLGSGRGTHFSACSAVQA